MAPIFGPALFTPMSAPIAGMIVSRYHSRNGIRCCCAGTMFAKTFMPITTAVTALAAPSLPIVLAETVNIMVLTSGSAIVAMTTAAAGSGLN